MKKRFEMRRSSKQAMEIITNHWDIPLKFETGDLSPRGAFIKTDFMPGMGENIICSFNIKGKTNYDFFGKVVRTNLMRRITDKQSGFGVKFLDTTPIERIKIREELRGTPPPSPTMRKISKTSKVKKRK